jgi:hypothetical protein
MAREKKEVIPLYDWCEWGYVKKGGLWKLVKKDMEHELLIYKGRVPDNVDPGIVYSEGVLRRLLDEGKLTGRALVFAERLFA